MTYLSNTAASVRQMGIKKSAQIAHEFKEEWIKNHYIPEVLSQYKVDKKGFNYRMCCLNSLAAVMPYISKEQVTTLMIPALLMGAKDDIPNVKFCMSKIVFEKRAYIDANVYSNQIVPVLRDQCNDPDMDVKHFAKKALEAS